MDIKSNNYLMNNIIVKRFLYLKEQLKIGQPNYKTE